jgi:hypothetical protein
VRRRPTAREQEETAARRPARPAPPAPAIALTAEGEALAMLRRRGYRPRPWPPDLPFPPGLPEERVEAFARRLDHYAFRLFLRGTLGQPDGFQPSKATRYVDGDAARVMAESLVGLGLAERSGRGRYRLLHPPRSFGGTLEWYLARELRHRLGFDTAAGLRFAAPGVGGDLDVVAAAEGRLVLLEVKSSPPRQLEEGEVRAFFERLAALGPDLALFVVDTALRLGDKVVPLLGRELARHGGTGERPRRLRREVWALTPRLLAVGAKGGLLTSIEQAVAFGLRARGEGGVGGR